MALIPSSRCSSVVGALGLWTKGLGEKFHSGVRKIRWNFLKSYLPGVSITKVAGMVVNSVFQFNK